MMTIGDFLKLDIRVGTVVEAKLNKKEKKPAYILYIDFGDEIGIKGSFAQLCENYELSDFKDRQIVAVINFPPCQVAGFKSEVLVLGLRDDKKGTILIKPTEKVKNGSQLA